MGPPADGGVLRKDHAAIRTVRRPAVRHRPGRSVHGRVTPLRRDQPRGAIPAGVPPQRQRRPDRAARAGPPRRAGPLRQCRQPAGPVAGRGHPRPGPLPLPLRLPDGLARRARHQRGHRGPGYRRRERVVDLPPRADPPQAQERPPRPAGRHPGQPVPHLGALPDPRVQPDLRAHRSTPVRGRGHRRRPAPAVGDRRRGRHRRRPGGRGRLRGRAGRRTSPLRDGPGLPGGSGRRRGRRRGHGPGGRAERGPTRGGRHPPRPLRASRRTRPGRRVLLVVRPHPGRRLRSAHHQRPRASPAPWPC